MVVRSVVRALIITLLLTVSSRALAAALVVTITVDAEEACCFQNSEDATLSSAISDHPSVVAVIAPSPFRRFYVQATFSNGDKAMFWRAQPGSGIQWFYVKGTAKDKNGKKICWVPNLSTVDPDGYATSACDPQTAAQIEWIGCTGLTPRYLVTWWSGSGGGPIDSFVVQRKVGSSWQPYWNGGETCIPLSTGSSPVTFRAMGTNASGTSDWVTIFLAGITCDGGGVP